MNTDWSYFIWLFTKDLKTHACTLYIKHLQFLKVRKDMILKGLFSPFNRNYQKLVPGKSEGHSFPHHDFVL